jgi:hypothetical protein
MMRRRRRTFLKISSILCIIATVVVATRNGDNGRKRRTNIRGANSIQQRNERIQRDHQRNLELPYDWDFDDWAWDMDFRLPKDDGKAVSKGGSNGVYAHTEPPRITPGLATLEPTTSPTTLIRTENAANLAIDNSTKSQPGMNAGIGISSMGIVFVLMFFATRQKRKGRNIMTMRKHLRLRAASLSAKNTRQEKCFGGSFRLIDHHNFDAFLSATGVPWALRTAATKARPVHSITHKGDVITMKFKGVPRATYIIDGPMVENILRDRTFECRATYTKDSNGFEVHKQSLDDGDYNIHLVWCLSDDKRKVRLTMTAHFEDDRELVKCTQVYKRIEDF